MKFHDAMKQLHPKLREGGDVQMTQGQFGKMLKQFYDAGYKEGAKDMKEAYEEALDELGDASSEAFREVDKAFAQADKAFAQMDKASDTLWQRVTKAFRKLNGKAAT